MTTQSWEALRKEARRLETEIDTKLVDYSKLVANANLPATSRASSFDNLRAGDALQRRAPAQSRDAAAAAALAAAEDSTAVLEALLARLGAVVDALGAGDGGGAGAAHRAHTVQRHSEILHDYHKELRKTRKSVAALRDSVELFAGAAPPPPRVAPPPQPAADALHAERVALAGAAAAADAAAGTGMSLKEDLERQRAMFASMVERMETMSEGIPAVNRLIGQIRRKKKRDVLVMALVVATLLFFTFSWKIAH